MIKANELRVGNWLDLNGKAVQVLALEKDDIVVEGFGGSGSAYESIPLAPEIFDKIGWTKVHWATGVVYEGFFTFEQRGDEWVLCDHDFTNIKPLKYVHELQNFIFAMTGEEIQITL